MNFAEDLIPVILQSNGHWWDRDLARLALVSPGWLYYIRRRLYAAPSLYSFAACASLARTFASNPYLASLVRHLSLRPTYAGTSRGSGKDRIAVRTLLGLEGLHSLVLGGELAIQSERFLGFVTAADTLQRLHIDGTLLRAALTARASVEWSEDMASRFPNLKSLRLTELDLDISFASAPLPIQWSELTLESTSIVGGILSQLVPEGSTLGRLCIKASSACEYDDHIQMVLYSSDVESFEYEVQKASPYDGSFLEPEDAASTEALSLRRLALRGLHVDNGVLSRLRQRCPEIEELVVSTRLIFVSPEDWETFLTSGALPSLRSLQLTRGTNHPPYQPWNEDGVRVLTEAASQRRIELLPL
ncbi:hypothetical protein NP233_g11743 [Leucocoprinus birnbaumii]|uniref:Uncharacterized protein n=1 Tax=Leucocoprinus birnbaumii TaxID=56174 RepID=A0AAD5YQM9_9AGAR|nr:hypothetical protein NP233_g11743 [Leucocoprinus birnbaumii]